MMIKATTHRLSIPDALIAWGKAPEQAGRWRRPWAHEVEACLKKVQTPCFDCSGSGQGDDLRNPCDFCEGTGIKSVPMAGDLARRFWARLDALVCHAVWEGQHDLLVELDTFSAQILGLRFTFSDGSRTVSVGHEADWPMPELEALLEANLAPEQVTELERVRDTVCEVFSEASIDAIWSQDEDAAARPEDTCASCKTTEAAVMVESASGLHYCTPCWNYLTEPWPRVEYRGTKLIVVPAQR